MKIVIDIPDDKWKSYQPYKGLPYDNIMDNSVRYIADGTPLPKGHGDLIDRSEVIKSLFDYHNGKKTIGQCIDDVQTIIEADGGDEDGFSN